jgi:hypothetical protein
MTKRSHIRNMQKRVNATLYFTYASSNNHFENSQINK